MPSTGTLRFSLPAGSRRWCRSALSCSLLRAGGEGKMLVLLNSERGGREAVRRLERVFDRRAPVMTVGNSLHMDEATVDDLVQREAYANAVQQTLDRDFTLDATELATRNECAGPEHAFPTKQLGDFRRERAGTGGTLARWPMGRRRGARPSQRSTAPAPLSRYQSAFQTGRRSEVVGEKDERAASRASGLDAGAARFVEGPGMTTNNRFDAALRARVRPRLPQDGATNRSGQSPGSAKESRQPIDFASGLAMELRRDRGAAGTGVPRVAEEVPARPPLDGALDGSDFSESHTHQAGADSGFEVSSRPADG